MADRNKEYVRELTFRMARIVLATINAKWIHPSLALRLLKANLGNLEKHCEILEFALRQPLGEKVEPILAARPRILGISVSIWNHLATLELLKTLEEKWRENQTEQTGKASDKKPFAAKKPFVVLGGPEVSWLPPEAEIFRHADYVIRGEGEISFGKLCRVLLETSGASALPGKFIEGIPAGLNTIDSGYRLYREEDTRQKLLYVESSRGCPFGCEFCLSSRDSIVRYFPLEAFLSEMERLIDKADGNVIDKGARTFKFLDRTFNLDIDRAIKIMEFFLDKIEAALAAESSGGPGAGHLPCVHFEMVPSRLPPALRETIRRFPPGTLRLELGIQTFNAETASLIHRSGNPGEELETLGFLRRETNAILHVDLIAGLPGESSSSFGEGVDRLWRALSLTPGKGEGEAARALHRGAPFEIQLGILKCLPGTPIVRHNGTHRMRYSQEPPYEVIETGAVPAGELERIKNFARFWELLVNRNPFPALMPRFLPSGEPVFAQFMKLSDKLLLRFGRNWGIDREKLRLYLEEIL